MQMLKSFTFNFSFLIAILLHLFFFTVFRIDTITKNFFNDREIKISFINVDSFCFEENQYPSEKDILDTTIEKQVNVVKNNEVFKVDGLYIDMKKMESNNEEIDQNSKDKTINKIKEDVSFQISTQRKVLKMYYPGYPLWAKKMGLEAEVKLRFNISKQGFVHDIIFEKMSRYPELDILGVRAIRKWKFEPDFNDESLDEWCTVVLKFTIE